MLSNTLMRLLLLLLAATALFAQSKEVLDNVKKDTAVVLIDQGSDDTAIAYRRAV